MQFNKSRPSLSTLRARKIYPEKSSGCNYMREIKFRNVKYFDTSSGVGMAKKILREAGWLSGNDVRSGALAEAGRAGTKAWASPSALPYTFRPRVLLCQTWREDGWSG
jgi:hypothetical protein